MIHGQCVQCKKGTLFNCGSFYRCDFCGYEEPTKVAAAKLPVRPLQERPAGTKTTPGERQLQLFDTTDFIGFGGR